MSNLFNNIKPLTNNLFSNQNNPRNPTTSNTEEKKTETQELTEEEEPPHHYITMTDNTQTQPQVEQKSEDTKTQPQVEQKSEDTKTQPQAEQKSGDTQTLKGDESDVEIAKKLSAIVDSANERVKPLLDTMNEVFCSIFHFNPSHGA
jgi:hypothetical protein